MSHQFGRELRLMVGDLLRAQVCRSTDEILTTQQSWKAAMIEKGGTSAVDTTGLRSGGYGTP
jgi:hypothetical protein